MSVLDRECYITEERWIDFHLGKLHPEEAAAMLRHRQACASCAAASEEWEAMLSPLASAETEMETSFRAPAMLRARVRLRGAANRAKRALSSASRRRGAAAVSLSAFAILMAVLAYGRMGGPGKTVDPQDYAEHHVPVASQVLSRPDTVVYKLDADSVLPSEALPPPTRETVWINKRTHELFLLLEGMLPSNEMDVQAWAYAGGAARNLGLLEFNDDLAHLYSSNVSPEDWESLALTIEPKGGSLSPTAPQTASVRLDGGE
ncbi:anti-sigma factor [Cohnella sp. AR92]|uniref:anti-sigma factor n=1 Tax=Cohnella sp. AR92 TaxID=648716 RepID=UPI000F8EC1A1|nr:anti-sigma factor [Cohnella sp. AR92]RUS48099.1 anti-sigma factor [Cohnella sp. AR92]